MGSILSSLFQGGPATPATAGPSQIIVFNSSKQWQDHFNSSKQLNKLMVVDFAASWCGPCKFMEPFIEGLAAKYAQVVEFVKIDVDQLPGVSKEFRVEAMPTLVLFKQGREMERVVGANKDELQRKILHHLKSVSSYN